MGQNGTKEENISLISEVISEDTQGEELCEIMVSDEDMALRMIKSQKYDLKSKNYRNCSIFMLACCWKKVKIAEYLLKRQYTDPFEINSAGFTSLLYSSRYKSMKNICYQLIKLGSDPGQYNDDLITPLMYACGSGSEMVALELIQLGYCNISMADINGETALHIAIRFNKYNVINAIMNDHTAEIDFLGYSHLLSLMMLVEEKIKQEDNKEYWYKLFEKMKIREKGNTTSYIYVYPPYPSSLAIGYISKKEFSEWYKKYQLLPIPQRFSLDLVKIINKEKELSNDVRMKHNLIEKEYHIYCEELRMSYVRKHLRELQK